MRVKAYFVCAVLMVVAFASAQTGGSTVVGQKGHRAHNAAILEGEIMAKLNLTSTQKDQVKVAFKTMTDSLRELRKSEKGTIVNAEDRKTKTQAIRKTYADSLKTILTPGQWIQLKEIRKELRKKAEAAKLAAASSAPKTP